MRRTAIHTPRSPRLQLVLDHRSHGSLSGGNFRTTAEVRWTARHHLKKAQSATEDESRSRLVHTKSSLRILPAQKEMAQPEEARHYTRKFQRMRRDAGHCYVPRRGRVNLTASPYGIRKSTDTFKQVSIKVPHSTSHLPQHLNSRTWQST